MAKKKNKSKIRDYRHDEKRENKGSDLRLTLSCIIKSQT